MSKSLSEMIIKATKNYEPMFLLRAQDDIALEVVEKYIELAKIQKCSPEFIKDCEEILDNFLNWRTKNIKKVKKPD